MFDRLFDIPREKKNAEYRNYLQALVDYLVDYVARVKPVMDLDNLFHEIEQDFEKDFVAGTFPGWPVSLFTTFFYFLYNPTNDVKFIERDNRQCFGKRRCSAGYFSVFILWGIGISRTWSFEISIDSFGSQVRRNTRRPCQKALQYKRSVGRWNWQISLRQRPG